MEKGQGLRKQMNAIGIIILIAIVSATPPIATDLCLPAIPDMPAYFNTSEAVVNLMLVGFFFFMAVGMLLLGPLSDKYGRKKVLVASLLVFAGCSALCSFAVNIWMLVALRVIQGLGGGGMVSIGTALVKDCFEGDMRAKVLVAAMAIGVVAPMFAPVLGAFILTFTTWQGTFVAQAVVALCALPLALRLVEPLAPEDRVTESLGRTLGRLVVVGRNKNFIFLLLCCALCSAPYMAYISSASYIYTGFFGLSKLEYSAFFAANAVVSAVGAWLVIAVQKRVAPRVSLPVSFGLSLLSGIGLLLVGHLSPFSFLAVYAVFTLCGGFIRPCVTAVLLEQQEGDTGSASSLINTTNTVLGSVGMLCATLPWSTYINGLGICITVAVAVAFAGLLVILLSGRFNIKGL